MYIGGCIILSKGREKNSQNWETYTWFTYRPFKVRPKEHNDDMADPYRKSKSTLAGHIWSLKDKGIQFNIRWSILARAPPFIPVTRKCMLCLKEKYLSCVERVQ